MITFSNETESYNKRLQDAMKKFGDKVRSCFGIKKSHSDKSSICKSCICFNDCNKICQTGGFSLKKKSYKIKWRKNE